MARFDAVVIGSGPAGLEAAINLKIRNKSLLLFGTPELSRKLTAAPRIDNYLGMPGISGQELQQLFLQHLQQMEISILSEQIQMVYPMGNYFSLASSRETYESTTVILATGTSSARMLVGEEEFLGRGVGYCATCDAPLYRGKTVAVLGYTDEAIHEANYVAELAATVYYVPMRPTALQPDDKVEVVSDRATGVAGDTQVRSLLLGSRELSVDGVFILRETVAPTSLIPGIAVQNGLIQVDSAMATNLPGCFAAGDCTGKPHQYMRAAGQGLVAAHSAVAYLDHLKMQQ